MSVVAPVAGLLSLSVPVAVGVMSGERPGHRVLAGIGLAALAIAFVGKEEDAPLTRPGPALAAAVGAGIAGGVFYVLLDRTGPAAGLWPLLSARTVSLAVLGVSAVARRPPWRCFSARVAAVVVLAGLLDSAANVLYLVAVRQGLLSVVATLTSLYPASTVLLARLALREPLHPTQRAGLALGAIAVPLITAG
jgi:drug/metabolite transporter (DMT)-like permease